MKNLLLLLSFITVLSSCEKTKEQVAENLVIKAMTDGQWKVTKLVAGTTNATPGFAPYKFQFRSNNTVEALNSGANEATGTWNADAEARTISSTFSSANATLTLLNGTWKITNNSWTYVEATQTVNGEVRTLRLDK